MAIKYEVVANLDIFISQYQHIHGCHSKTKQAIDMRRKIYILRYLGIFFYNFMASKRLEKAQVPINGTFAIMDKIAVPIIRIPLADKWYCDV